MSRVGREPIIIPEGVTVEIKGNVVKVSGPKGSLSLEMRPEIKAEVKEGKILVARQSEEQMSRALHGLTRTLIDNLIIGVTQGYEKTLKIEGIGYRAAMEGETLVLSVGFSHPVKINPPLGIKFETGDNNLIKISGIDKCLVGQWTARVRATRPPEPYKGKGIRYLDEKIKRKAGKAGKAGAAGVPVPAPSVAGGGGGGK